MSDELVHIEIDGVVLAHHGVKGMKWGVRKSEGGDAKSTSSSAAKAPKAERPKMKPETKKKVALGLAAAGGLTVAALVGLLDAETTTTVTSYALNGGGTIDPSFKPYFVLKGA